MIVLTCLASYAFGQKSKKPVYKIRASRGGVAVTFQGKAHFLKIGDKIDAAKVTEAEVMFANEKDGFRYLLIDVSGGSRASDFDRQCGAGTESNVIWLKLNGAWKILDVKAVRYQSCWSGIDLNDPFRRTKDSLAFEFDNISDNLNVKFSYNANEPEKGFQIVETKLKGN